MTIDITVNKEKIHLDYDVFGNGKPIVFIHGGGTDYHFYQNFLNELSNYYKVYTFSYPGFGKSSNMKNYNLENYLNVIDQFLYQMHLTSVCLIGHSMGAGLAGAYTSKFPNNVNAIVLLSPFLHIYTKTIFSLAKDLSREGILEKEYIPAYKHISNNRFSLIISKFSKLSKIINFLKLYAFLRNTDISKLLQITKPAIGIIGEEDIVLDPTDQLNGLNQIKNIEIIKYPSYGHNVLFAKQSEIISKIRKIY